MAQPDQTASPSTSCTINRDSGAASSPPFSSADREASGAASSSSSSSNSPSPPSSSSQVREGEEEDHDRYEQHFRLPEIEQQHNSVSYRGNLFGFDDASVIREDTWSCVVVVLTFWFFVAMTMILGVFGSVNLTLGPNCSVLTKPNPLFVQSIKVEELDNDNPGLMLYGFYESPPLDVIRTWSKTHNVSVPSDFHKEWVYFLNKGSQINISYSVEPPNSSVFLVIAQGNEGLAQWLDYPAYPNTTLSWNVVHGSGIVLQNISKSSSYYVAVGNLNSEEVEVQLNLRVRAFLYNTTEAYYKCTFTGGMCRLSILFPNGNAVVLTSPGPEEGSHSDEWNVKLSYGPRWATYIVGIAGMTLLMLAAFNFFNNFRSIHEEGTGVHFGEVEPERAPLLSYKDDDLSSWGSSYDSVSNDEEDIEDFLTVGSLEGKSSRDGENGNNTRRLCAICFDAPRDCFFLPCGHCVACYACGIRITEAAGTCPMCRRNMKKVRKIFTV